MPNFSTSKTLSRGLSKTRSGSPSISIQKLINAGFSDRIKKAVSEDDALDAAKMLSTKGRARRYVEGGVIGGAAYPLTAAAGEVAGALAGHGSGKLRAAGAAAKATFKRPELAKSVTRGALGGGVIQAVREGVELGRAKNTVRSFVEERTPKLSSITRAVYVARKLKEHLDDQFPTPGTGKNVYDAYDNERKRSKHSKLAFAVPSPGKIMGAKNVGAFAGKATTNFLKPVGPTTTAIVNPRASLRVAMTKGHRT